MGTRSTIKFYEKIEEDLYFLCNVYQQYDGYIGGVGNSIKRFIKSKPFVNGIGSDENVFNGAGCFVAQFIKEFKTRPGGLYIYSEEETEEYNYKIVLCYKGKGFEYRVSKVIVTLEGYEDEKKEFNGFDEEIDV